MTDDEDQEGAYWADVGRRVSRLADDLTDLGLAVLVRWQRSEGVVHLVAWDGIGPVPPEIAAFPGIEANPDA